MKMTMLVASLKGLGDGHFTISNFMILLPSVDNISFLTFVSTFYLYFMLISSTNK